jgi:hypothetical protein
MGAVVTTRTEWLWRRFVAMIARCGGAIAFGPSGSRVNSSAQRRATCA